MQHTLVHQLATWAQTTPDAPALFHRVSPDTWEHRTWKRYWQEARDVAKGLMTLGHQPGDCVAVSGENRPEWVLTELGVMTAAGIPAPIYTTNTPAQMGYIVTNAAARIVVCDGREQFDKYQQATADGHMTTEWYVTMDDIGVERDDVLTYAELIARGQAAPDAPLDARVDALNEDDTALLIYTSGTTGTPKGVMLHHGAMVSVADSLLQRLKVFADTGATYRTVSYLPLCHGAEQLLTTLGHLKTGGEVYFCNDMKQIKDYLVAVRPSIFLGVPRVWEKFEAALAANFAQATGLKAKLLSWARRVELAAVDSQVRTGKPVQSVRRTLANRLVLHKVRAAVGFDNMVFAVTGSAPISTGTLEFFASLGVPVYEAYGLSETTGVCTIGEPGQPRFGKVGRALDGVELRIAEDGEVLTRGRTMTRGYFHMPEETEQLFDADGWLRTGDVGELDAEGNLSITGRKKELIITAGGKNVAPVELEAYLQQILGVAQAVVVGDRQPYLCALITIDVEALPELVAKFGGAATVEAMADNAAFRAHVEAEVETRCNAKVARYQTIKKVALLAEEFSVEGGELTATMKIRRNEIVRKYADRIAAFYTS